MALNPSNSSNLEQLALDGLILLLACCVETGIIFTANFSPPISLLLAIFMALSSRVEAATTAARTTVDGEDTTTEVDVPLMEPWLEPCGTPVMQARTRSTRHRQLQRRFRGVELMASRMTEISEEIVASYVSMRHRLFLFKKIKFDFNRIKLNDYNPVSYTHLTLPTILRV